MEKLLSVIVPVYGVEKYIAECLESIINQSYQNLQIIVINDGTKDRSADIAREYAEKDNRIKVYNFPNGGLSVARNRGLKIADGEYIAFVDSDDFIHKDMYKRLIEKLEANDVDMVKCGFCEFFTDKKDIVKFKENKIYDGHNIEKYFEGILYTVVWNAVYKRDLALKVQFPENCVHEDNYSSGMYLYLSNKFMTVSDVYYYYRCNYSGISKSGIKRPLDKVIAITKLIKDLAQYGFSNKKLYCKLAREYYHVIKRQEIVRTICMERELYKFIKENLDLRRKLIFLYLIKKHNIKIL